MLKSVKNKIIPVLLPAFFIIIYIICSPVTSLSRDSYPEFLSINNTDHFRGIFEFLFNLPEINHGTLIDISETKEVSKDRTSRRRLVEDTTGNKENRIVSIRPNNRGDLLEVKLSVVETDQNIQFLVYNLLGKIVLGPYDSTPSGNDYSYFINVSSLPNGVYLCVVIGRNFRLREKFIISR